MAGVYFDLMVSNEPKATVSIRALGAGPSTTYAYEVSEQGSKVRGTVEAQAPDLALVALVLNDYVGQVARKKGA